MKDILLNYSNYLIIITLGLLEALRGRFWDAKTDDNEFLIDATTFGLSFIMHPVVFSGVFAAGFWLVPQYQDSIKDWPWYALLPLYLIGEDMVQYWWHRLGHTKYTWVWHRAHHSAPYMGVRMTYRNGFLYSFFMPNVWINAALIFLGAGGFALGYGIVKALVTTAAHCELRWDSVLYRYKWLHPLAWVVERTISTPATHFSHHALSEGDGIGHYSGNFGNLLFFWDVLFGTALITRKYPPAFGVENDVVHGTERWYVQLFFPLFQSKRASSDFHGPVLWFPGKQTEAETVAAAAE